jgi:hypothetical protein
MRVNDTDVQNMVCVYHCHECSKEHHLVYPSMLNAIEQSKGREHIVCIVNEERNGSSGDENNNVESSSDDNNNVESSSDENSDDESGSDESSKHTHKDENVPQSIAQLRQNPNVTPTGAADTSNSRPVPRRSNSRPSDTRKTVTSVRKRRRAQIESTHVPSVAIRDEVPHDANESMNLQAVIDALKLDLRRKEERIKELETGETVLQAEIKRFKTINNECSNTIERLHRESSTIIDDLERKYEDLDSKYRRLVEKPDTT